MNRSNRPQLVAPVRPEDDAPFDHAAEQAVLGACLHGGRSYVERAARVLQPKDFHDPRNRLIFAAMLRLLEQGRPIDPVTVPSFLRGDA